MDVNRSSAGGDGFAAYERGTVERFFLDARAERSRLLGDIATARRRIAEARVALAAANDREYSCIRAVVDAQRALRQEQRAHETTVAAVHAHAEAHAEQLLSDARSRAAATRTARPVAETDGGGAAQRAGDARLTRGVNGHHHASPSAGATSGFSWP